MKQTGKKLSLATQIFIALVLGIIAGVILLVMTALQIALNSRKVRQLVDDAVGFAALIIAAIPTLLVFIFCQNIIIKGIVVPSEK